MTETDTSRARVERLIAQMITWPGQGVYAADLMRALLARAEKAERQRDYNSEVIEQRNVMLTRAEAERDTAWNDAIEAAAHECEQVAYSGKYSQNDPIELGCLRCRDNIRALLDAPDA